MRRDGGRTVTERRVIIVGGGCGGVTLAQHLERKAAREIEIVLISSENHFVFTPMLAEVVGRSISPLHMAVAGRQMVRRTTWLTAQVTDIDLQTHLVRYVGEGGEHASLTYDHLVLACGSVMNMNMLPGLAAYSYPMKTLGETKPRIVSQIMLEGHEPQNFTKFLAEPPAAGGGPLDYSTERCALDRPMNPTIVPDTVGSPVFLAVDIPQP